MADRKHRVECTCHNPAHFIQFHYAEWGGYKRKDGTFIPRSSDVFVYWIGDRNFGFWRRLLHGLQFAFMWQEMIVSDFVISKESARETGQFLIEIADAADEWEAGEQQ